MNFYMVQKVVNAKDIYKESAWYCNNLDDVKDDNINYVIECDDDKKHCKIVKTIVTLGDKKLEFNGKLSKTDLLNKLGKSCSCGCSLKKVEY